ncbi:MAG: helix-turn-helix domain-containing protein [Acidimicrobiia bacterium]|nr:helix-turn-helix domain-containing protein [Acidimicrobiia bacterium]
MAEYSDFPPIMTAVQAAEFLSVHPEYLRQMVRDDRVPAHKIPGGRGWRFLRDELVDWIKEQPGAKTKTKSENK